jgi:hypothetical protein
MALWIGLYPKPFFEILEQPVNQLVYDVRPKDFPDLKGVVNASAQPAPSENVALVPASSSAKESK